MSMDYIACGAWGILLSEHEKLLGGVWKLLLVIQADCDEDEFDQQLAKALPHVKKALAIGGIVVPPEAELHYTGDESERPGPTSTPTRDFVLGFGLYSVRPDTVTKIHKTFKAQANWHTWVTAL